ncbi:MAG: hypothetical protein ACI82H_002040, partial [Alphaproteobacteria bacterium]
MFFLFPKSLHPAPGSGNGRTKGIQAVARALQLTIVKGI